MVISKNSYKLTKFFQNKPMDTSGNINPSEIQTQAQDKLKEYKQKALPWFNAKRVSVMKEFKNDPLKYETLSPKNKSILNKAYSLFPELFQTKEESPFYNKQTGAIGAGYGGGTSPFAKTLDSYANTKATYDYTNAAPQLSEFDTQINNTIQSTSNVKPHNKLLQRLLDDQRKWKKIATGDENANISNPLTAITASLNFIPKALSTVGKTADYRTALAKQKWIQENKPEYADVPLDAIQKGDYNWLIPSNDLDMWTKEGSVSSNILKESMKSSLKDVFNPQITTPGSVIEKNKEAIELKRLKDKYDSGTIVSTEVDQFNKILEKWNNEYKKTDIIEGDDIVLNVIESLYPEGIAPYAPLTYEGKTNPKLEKVNDNLRSLFSKINPKNPLYQDKTVENNREWLFGSNWLKKTLSTVVGSPTKLAALTAYMTLDPINAISGGIKTGGNTAIRLTDDLLDVTGKVAVEKGTLLALSDTGKAGFGQAIVDVGQVAFKKTPGINAAKLLEGMGYDITSKTGKKFYESVKASINTNIQSKIAENSKKTLESWIKTFAKTHSADDINSLFDKGGMKYAGKTIISGRAIEKAVDPMKTFFETRRGKVGATGFINSLKNAPSNLLNLFSTSPGMSSELVPFKEWAKSYAENYHRQGTLIANKILTTMKKSDMADFNKAIMFKREIAGLNAKLEDLVSSYNVKNVHLKNANATLADDVAKATLKKEFKKIIEQIKKAEELYPTNLKPIVQKAVDNWEKQLSDFMYAEESKFIDLNKDEAYSPFVRRDLAAKNQSKAKTFFLGGKDKFFQKPYTPGDYLEATLKGKADEMYLTPGEAVNKRLYAGSESIHRSLYLDNMKQFGFSSGQSGIMQDADIATAVNKMTDANVANKAKLADTVDNIPVSKKAIDRLREIDIQKETLLAEIKGMPGGTVKTNKTEELMNLLDEKQKIAQAEGKPISQIYQDYEKNTGFTAGKSDNFAEGIEKQSGGRDTGQYGSGTYFYSNKEGAQEYAKSFKQQGILRDVEDVDLTGKNMFRPKSEEEGLKLHDALKKANNEISPQKVSKVKNIYDEAADEIRFLGIRLRDMGIDITDEDILSIYKQVNTELNAVGGNWWTLRGDSISTRIIKKAGYNGVDVRGYKLLDNSHYGSVVYSDNPLEAALKYEVKVKYKVNDMSQEQLETAIEVLKKERLGSVDGERLIEINDKIEQYQKWIDEIPTEYKLPTTSTPVEQVVGELGKVKPIKVTKAELTQGATHVPNGFVVAKDSSGKAIEELKGYYFPPKIAKTLTRINETFFGNDSFKEVVGLLDKATSLWKRLALSTFGYQARNFYSDTFSGVMQWGDTYIDPEKWVKAFKIRKAQAIGGKYADEIIEISGKKQTAGLWAKEFGEFGVTGSGKSVVESEMHLIEQLEAQANKLNPMTLMTKVGGAREDITRMVGAMSELEAGSDMIQAAHMSKAVFFDYGDLASGDKFIRRFFIPFWSWTRKNMPRQIELALTRGGRLSVLPKVQRYLEEVAGGEPEGYDKYKQSYLDKLGGMLIGSNGEYSTWTPNLPTMDINKLNPKNFIEDITSGGSPLIKAVTDLTYGVNKFSGEKLNNQKTEPAPGWSKLLDNVLPDNVSKQLLSMLGIKTASSGEKFVSPIWEYIYKQNPALSNMERAIPYDVTDKTRSGLASLMLGVKTTPYNEKQQSEQYYKNKQSQLSTEMSTLRKQGEFAPEVGEYSTALRNYYEELMYQKYNMAEIDAKIQLAELAGASTKQKNLLKSKRQPYLDALEKYKGVTNTSDLEKVFISQGIPIDKVQIENIIKQNRISK